MLLNTRFFCVAALFAAASMFGSSAVGTPPAAEIIKRSVAANSADFAAQTNWAFREHDTESKLDSTGNPNGKRTKTFEVLRIDGSPYERLISVNGEPLSRERQGQEQAKLKQEIERRKRESPEDRRSRISKYQEQRAEEHMLMQQMVAAFEFKLVGEETVNGVDTYALSATANPAYRPISQKARVLAGMQGRLWVDKAHYHWVKVEAEVTKPVEFGFFLAKVKPGTSFELEQSPVGDVWLPKHFVQRTNASVLGLHSLHTQSQEDYSAYHLASLDAVNLGPAAIAK